MTNYIRKMSGKQYLKRIQENPTVIIPTGACEIYGPQLPMGSDLIVAKRISELVAEKTGAMIAPTIECGESSALAAFSCTFPMPRKILEDYLDFLMGKLIKDGIKNFIFITGHAGNVDTANYIGKKYLAEHGDIKLVQIDWWRFANANSGDIFQFSGQMAHGHASECGTSVMLYLYPELVDMDELTRIEPAAADGFGDFIGFAKFSDRTPNGTIGDATVATREKGEKIVTKCVDRIVSYIEQKF